MKIGVAFADIFTGLYAVIGIQAALTSRERTGRGQHLDMALLDSIIGVLANQSQNYLVSGKAPRRMGNAHPNLVPYQVFPTSDSFVIIGTGSDRQWAEVARILGVPELAQDERFLTNADRVKNRDMLIPLLVERTRRMTKAELLGQLEKVHVPAGPINTLAEVFSDPQVVARGMRIDLPATGARGGTVPGVSSPIRLSETPVRHERASPRLAEHTEEVLGALGYDGHAIEALEEAGVIGVRRRA
jgi:crotonobetainyl-CoA:carnitine CoA-transferase CaiB-like acyl-CoA transferase